MNRSMIESQLVEQVHHFLSQAHHRTNQIILSHMTQPSPTIPPPHMAIMDTLTRTVIIITTAATTLIIREKRVTR